MRTAQFTQYSIPPRDHCTNLPQIFNNTLYSRRSDGYCHVCHDCSSQTLESGQLLFLVFLNTVLLQGRSSALPLWGTPCLKVVKGLYFFHLQSGFLECFPSVSFITGNISGVISYFKLKPYPLYSLLAHLPLSPCFSIPVCKCLLLPLLVNNVTAFIKQYKCLETGNEAQGLGAQRYPDIY